MEPRSAPLSPPFSAPLQPSPLSGARPAEVPLLHSSVVAIPDSVCEVARLVALGLSVPDIIVKVGIDGSSVLKALEHPKFQSIVATFLPNREELDLRFKSEINSSIKRIAELRDQNDEKGVALAAAKELLAQAGVSPIKKIAIAHFSFSGGRDKVMEDAISDVIDIDPA